MPHNHKIEAFQIGWTGQLLKLEHVVTFKGCLIKVHFQRQAYTRGRKPSLCACVCVHVYVWKLDIVISTDTFMTCNVQMLQSHGDNVNNFSHTLSRSYTSTENGLNQRFNAEHLSVWHLGRSATETSAGIAETKYIRSQYDAYKWFKCAASGPCEHFLLPAVKTDKTVKPETFFT